jgi:RHS repeat-associated protein
MLIRMNRIFYCLVFLCLFSLNALYAQPVNNAIKDVSMPAPNAASLGKYGDIPVGYYTGVPSVGIPIYTVADGPLSLPVSLSYHAGGMKVGEPASWVGLGWSLQAGGMIARTIQGKADESCDGYFTSGKYMALQNDTCIAPADPYSYATVQNGTTDAEPDIFSFSVGGYNGKFYIEADLTSDGIVNGKVVLIPKQDVKVTYEVTSGVSCSSVFRLKKFTITIPDGTRYEFGNIDANVNEMGLDREQFNENSFSHVSAWHLRRISSADGVYRINLSYVQEKYRYQSKASGERIFSPFAGYPVATPNGNYSHHVIDILGWRLSTIKTTGNLSTVTFVANSATREDISTTTWNVGSSPEPPKSLSSIKIESDTYCKQFILSQSYYADVTTDNSGMSADKRLKLTSIQEKSCDNPITVTINPFTFQYYEHTTTPTFLPTRLSSAIDHWGFYNGASTNPHSGINIPLTKLASYKVGSYNVHPMRGTSDRETNEAEMKLGTLKKITYPTGGSTSFEYEANTFHGPKDVLTFPVVGTLNRPDGHLQCLEDPENTPVATFTLPAQSSTELNNLYYTWLANAPAPFPVSCTEGPYLSVRLYNGTTNAYLGQASTTLVAGANPSTAEGKLVELLSHISIPTGVPLKFTIKGKAMGGTFTLKKLVTTTTTINQIVGGLRIKKLVNNDGTTGGQDVVKSFAYDKAVIPGQSSAILYNKPIYGYVFQGCLGSCSGLRPINQGPCPGTSAQLVQTHFFFETSIVPLASFEGYHLGYSAVREYFNGSATGFYNLYQYYNDPAQTFERIPIIPSQPRIGSGELESKAQRNASSGDVAYDLYEKKADGAEVGLGVYLKFNTYITGGDPGGTPITFWRKYPIITRPFRYERVFSFRDGQMTTIDKQYNGAGHLQVSKETVTNSDGKVTATDYKYSFDMPGLPTAEKDKFIELNLLVPLETAVSVSGTQVSGSQTDYDFYSTTTGARTSTPSGSFIRPYQFKSFEAGWALKGEIGVYHGTGSPTGRAGLPKEFTKTGWDKESYEWTTAGLIKKRTFKDFNWQYEYAANTALVTKITNPDGQFSEYVYDPLMRLQEVKSRANNVKTAYTYTYPTVTSGVIGTFGNVKSTTTYAAIVGGVGTQESYQYFDGLGRNIETVHKGKTASGKDQVIATAYDNQGRVSKSFEPFATLISDGSYQAPGSNAHTLTQYEENPLNRAWKVTPPSWATTTTNYGVNTSADGVKNYNVTNGTATFGDNLLAKVTLTDGNGTKIISFNDKKGRLLLSRKTDGAETATKRSDTYYVYDDKDRLIRVIPPGATWTSDELVFTYQYTNNDLISEKKVPGKGKEVYEYNSRDLPVKYQDPFLRANSNRWMGSKYDTYGRLTEKGVWASGTGDAVVLTNKIIENIYGTTGIEIDKLKTSKVQAFTVADPVVTPGAANGVLQTTFNYDVYGRVSSTAGNNHTNLGSLTAESVTYSYDHGDNILSESRASVHSAGTTTIANTRLFDSWGRLTQTSQGINGATATIISRLAYTDKDQLAQKKIGPGANGLQQVDYGYLTNGLLSSINGTTALSGNAQGINSMLTGFTVPTFAATTEDLFRQELRYNTNITAPGATVQNSGNIGQMSWQVKGRTTQTYGFTYDHLDRLTAARFSNNKTDGTPDPDDYYGESQTFDVRGNITTITRKGMVKGTSSYTRSNIDGRALTIPAGGNLTRTSEGVNSSSSSVEDNFDAPHNHLNLPSKFDFGSNNTIELLYDGLGNKLRKTVKTNNVVTLTQNYLNGIELKNNAVEAVYNEEGRAFNNAGAFRYEYVLRDHLGNTRLVFSDKNGSGSIDNTEILGETHYYPFGKAFDGAWYNDATASKYKYLYNGKELSDEFKLNFYDYGARWLDPGMGSWWQVDPMAEKFPSLSPYSFAENNPVNVIDPDGMASQTIYDFDGNAHTGGDDDYASSSDNGGCPPNCPQVPMQADATSRAGKVTPQIADGGVQLPQREEAKLSNADSKLLPHEQAGVDGVSLGLQMAGSEIALAKALRGAGIALKAAKTEVTVYRVFGGDARAQGFSWTTVNPTSVKDFRNLAGLPSGGASGAMNTADFMLKGKVDVNNIIQSRSALPLDGQIGGLPELIIDPKNVRLINFKVLKP